jgi:hypothetical protein
MISQSNLRLALIVSSMSLFLMTGQSAHAQYRFQTADGHQTVAPSDMPQQPSMAEEFMTKSNMMNNSSPQPSLDLPGTPGVVNGPPSIQTPNGKFINPGQPPTSGSLVYPNGISSATRIGPVEPTPIWTRVALGVFLMVQFAAMTVVAIVLQRKTTRHDLEYQGGHIIEEGHQEEWVHRHKRSPEL